MRPRSLRALTLAAVLLLATPASGCLVQQVNVRQDVGGPVEVEVLLCQQDDVPPVTLECDPAAGDANRTPAVLQTGGSQVFIGFLVPAAVVPRDAVMSGGLTGPLLFDQLLSDRFTALETPPAGRRWVGFKSGALPNGSTNTARLLARFDVPPALAGQPFPYRATVSGRAAATATEANAPIGNIVPVTIPAIAGTSLTGEVPVRNATVAPGQTAPVEVRRGQTASVPFVVDYAGSTGSGQLAVSASTTLPGATAAADANPISFSVTGARQVWANVAVPQNAPVGDHDVRLSLPLPGGPSRMAIAKLRVLADPAAPPAAPPAPPSPPSVSQGSGTAPLPSLPAIRTGLRSTGLLTTRRSAILRDGLRFVQQFLTPGTTTWELRRDTSSARGALLGRTTARITGAGQHTTTLRLSPAGARAVRRVHRARLVLTTTFVDTTGRQAVATRRLRLR